MKKTKRVISLLLSIIMLLSITAGLNLSAYAEDSGDYIYSVLSDGTIEITNYFGFDSSLTIPSQIAGKKVTSIGMQAFAGCDNLTSVTIPSSITSIGDNAFAHCDSLTGIYVDTNNNNYSSYGGVLYNKNRTELIQYPQGKTESSFVIPNTVKGIERGAFISCSSLTSITIPSSVTSIECGFYLCNNLTNIYVDANNNHYSSYSGVLYNKSKTKLISCPQGKKGSYTIPNTVTSIADSAFYGCTCLSIEAIPSSVTSIGDYAFYNCSLLTSVTIPNGVTSIGFETFCACLHLTSVKIPNSVTSIDAWAFRYCYNLTSVTIPNSVTSIGHWAFENCSRLTDITVLNKNCEIGYDAIPSNTTIYGYNGSTAQTYAKENGNKFVSLGNAPSSSVSLSAPQNLAVSNLSTTGATLTWNAVSGASGYELQYLLNGSWKTMCEVAGNSKTFTQLTSNRLYVMRVRTFKTVNGVKTYSNSWSAPIAFTTYTTTDRMTFSNLSKTGAKVALKAVTDAGTYEIQYLLGGKWVTMCEVASNTKTFTQLTSNRLYTMRFRAFKTVNGTKVYSSNWSAAYSFTTYPTVNRMSFSNINSKGATLKINTVQNAGAYEIQYLLNGKWVTMCEIASNTKTFTQLTANRKYTMRMRAFKTVNGTKSYSSNWSGAYSFTTSR